MHTMSLESHEAVQALQISTNSQSASTCSLVGRGIEDSSQDRMI